MIAEVAAAAVAATCPISHVGDSVSFGVTVTQSPARVVVIARSDAVNAPLARIDAAGGAIVGRCKRARVPRRWDLTGLAGPLPLARAHRLSCGSPRTIIKRRLPATVLIEVRHLRSGGNRLLVRFAGETAVYATVRGRGGTLRWQPFSCANWNG